MPSPIADPGAAAADGEAVPLSRIFTLILATEALSIAALYWFGRHFG